MSGTTTAAVPAYDHIVVVVEENHGYNQIVGNSNAPYINSLAASGALLTNDHAITHPSEPNYFALYAGSTFGVTDDNPHNEPDPTLYTILKGAGLSFTGYVDPGATDMNHNPWEYFPEGTSVEKNFATAFPQGNFASLPTVSFVTPNVNHDMHNGSIAAGDSWLKSNLGAYAQWAQTHNSLLVVTFDENDGSSGNRIATVLDGAHIAPGTVNNTSYNHYNLLSTILASHNLTGPNQAATAAPLAVFDPPASGGGGQTGGSGTGGSGTGGSGTGGTGTGGSQGQTPTGLHYAVNGNFDHGSYNAPGDPGSDGFNLADISSASQLSSLPSGVKGLLYLGMTGGVTAAFQNAVMAAANSPNLYGFYIADEPASDTISNIKAESDWIHAHAPGKITFITGLNVSSDQSPKEMFTPANSHLDLIGLDPYPVRPQNPGGMDLSVISKGVSAAEAAGWNLSQIVPVYQAFGGGGYSSWTMPTASQEQQILAAWKAAVPNPAFDYAYSWGSQSGDQSLAGSSALQQVFAAHNAGH